MNLVRRQFGLSSKPSYKVALSGLVIMPHNYDYISYFLPCLDVPVSFGNLFQRIASIYYWSKLSCLNKLFEKKNVFFSLFWNRKYNFFSAKY